MYRIGIDLGGTNIAVGVVNDHYEIVARRSVPTGAERPAEEVIRDMGDAVEEALRQAGLTAADCASMGVGSPGACDPQTGVVKRAYNLNWFDVPVCRMLHQRFGIPVRLGNDANCAALAEVVAGAAVVVWLVSRRLTHPLTVLTAASARIAAGDYALRTRMHTGDELEILSQGFDQMAGAVQDKVEALELSVQQRDDFVGAFTHELKTPMTGIIGYADLLRSMQPDPEEQREAAGAIFHEAQRLEALSGKLLQLMGLGEHAPQLVPVQLDSVFAEARRAVAPALNGCILTMQSNGLTVQGDADLLCDLVINLVTNAAKASTPGSAIAVCAEQADGSIRLTVQDHGQGIPADKLARVVEPFYMVDKSRSRRQGGSGLGLALCSRIAQAHGGTLAMESELGKGTTVTVTLPAPNQTAAELAQEEPV